MLIKKEVKTFVTHWYHDGCGGEYLPTGVALLSSPPQYPHVCKMCKDEKTVRGIRYPLTSYEEVLT